METALRYIRTDDKKFELLEKRFYDCFPLAWEMEDDNDYGQHIYDIDNYVVGLHKLVDSGKWIKVPYEKVLTGYLFKLPVTLSEVEASHFLQLTNNALS